MVSKSRSETMLYRMKAEPPIDQLRVIAQLYCFCIVLVSALGKKAESVITNSCHGRSFLQIETAVSMVSIHATD